MTDLEAEQLEKEALLFRKILEHLKPIGQSGVYIAEMKLTVPEQLDLVKMKRELLV